MRKRLLIGLGLLLVLTPALLLILSPPAHAPHTAPAPPALPADVPIPDSSSAPAHKGEPESASASPVALGLANESAEKTVEAPDVVFRLIDDRSGNPVANARVRIADLQWHGVEASICGFPPPHDGDPLSTETGEIEPVWELDYEDFRNYLRAIYPLPESYLPVTKPTEVWLAVEARLRGEAQGPILVRVERCPALTVRCVNEAGQPLPGVVVRAFPDFAEARNSRLFAYDPPKSLHEAGPIKPRSPPNQSGTGHPEGVSFEFEDEPVIYHDDSIQWIEATDEAGCARFDGLENMRWDVVAFGRGAAIQEQSVELNSDTEIVFTFSRAAELLLRLVYVGAEPLAEDGRHVIHFAGGTLSVEHGGHNEVTVKLEGIAPGVYELEPADNPQTRVPRINTRRVPPHIRRADLEAAGGSPVQAAVLRSGQNDATVWLGDDAWCEWRCEVTVNGSPLDGVVLPWRAKGVDPRRLPDDDDVIYLINMGLRGRAVIDEGKPVKMVPGAYMISIPDGSEREITFRPGVSEYTRIDLVVREVTFTISDDLHRLLEPHSDLERGTVDLRMPDQYRKDAISLLGEALLAQWSSIENPLEELAPGRPVTLPIPAGVYEVSLDHPSPWRTQLRATLDLRDLSIRSMELSLDGWSGVGLYNVRWDPDMRDDGAKMLLPDIGRWDADYAIYDDDGFIMFAPVEGVPITNHSKTSAWLPKPGTYVIKAASVLGQCSIRLTGEGEKMVVDAWLRWRRDGVDFFAPVYESDDGPYLPAGSATLVVRAYHWGGTKDGTYRCAELKVYLTGDHEFKLDELQWKECGEVHVRTPTEIKADVTFYSPGSYHGQDELRRGSTVEHRSALLPPGEYKILIDVPGRPLEIRTVRVQSGRTTVLDLR